MANNLYPRWVTGNVVASRQSSVVGRQASASCKYLVAKHQLLVALKREPYQKRAYWGVTF